MFFFLSKTLDVLLSPWTWAVAAIAVGLTGKSPARRSVGLAGLGILCLFSFEPLANGLERALESRAPRTYRAEVTYDAVIVLGGLVDRTTLPSAPAYNDNVERLLVAFDLLRRGRVRNAVLSGGALDATQPGLIEATTLADQLVDWGVDPARLFAETRSRNTRDNAVESRRIAEEHGWTSLLVVTSAFHMPRALACFRAVHLPVDALPVDYRAYDPARFSGSWLPRASHLERSDMALREWFGYGIYWLRGYAR